MRQHAVAKKKRPAARKNRMSTLCQILPLNYDRSSRRDFAGQWLLVLDFDGKNEEPEVENTHTNSLRQNSPRRRKRGHGDPECAK